MVTINGQVILEQEKKDKRSKWANTGCKKTFIPIKQLPPRGVESSEPQIDYIQLIGCGPSHLCAFAHAVPSAGKVLHTSSSPKPFPNPSRIDPVVPSLVSPSPLPLTSPLRVELFVFIDASTPCTQLHHMTHHNMFWWLLLCMSAGPNGDWCKRGLGTVGLCIQRLIRDLVHSGCSIRPYGGYLQVSIKRRSEKRNLAHPSQHMISPSSLILSFSGKLYFYPPGRLSK